MKKPANGNAEPNVVLGQSMGGVIARYLWQIWRQRSLTHIQAYIHKP